MCSLGDGGSKEGDTPAGGLLQSWDETWRLEYGYLASLSVPFRAPGTQVKMAVFTESGRRRKLYNWPSIARVEEI